MAAVHTLTAMSTSTQHSTHATMSLGWPVCLCPYVIPNISNLAHHLL